MPDYMVYTYTHSEGKLMGKRSFRKTTLVNVRKTLMRSLKRNHQYEVYSMTAQPRYIGTLTEDGFWTANGEDEYRVLSDGTVRRF